MRMKNVANKVSVLMIGTLASGALSSNAMAHGCADPLPLSEATPIQADTCLASDSIPWFDGGIPSPQPDVVHRISPGVSALSLSIQSQAAHLIGVVIPACSTSAPILAMTDIAPGQTAAMSWNDPTAAGGYLIITGDPAGPTHGCGSYQVTTTTSPPPSGTCANPLPMSTNSIHSGDTCQAAELNLVLDGLVLPHRGEVHEFDPSAVNGGQLHLQANDFGLYAFVSDSCTSTLRLAAFVPSGSADALDVSSLAPGNYTLLVTSDPSVHLGECGSYTLTTGSPGRLAGEAVLPAAANTR